MAASGRRAVEYFEKFRAIYEGFDRMEGVEEAALAVANADEKNPLQRAKMMKIRTKKRTIS